MCAKAAITSDWLPRRLLILPSSISIEYQGNNIWKLQVNFRKVIDTENLYQLKSGFQWICPLHPDDRIIFLQNNVNDKTANKFFCCFCSRAYHDLLLIYLLCMVSGFPQTDASWSNWPCFSATAVLTKSTLHCSKFNFFSFFPWWKWHSFKQQFLWHNWHVSIRGGHFCGPFYAPTCVLFLLICYHRSARTLFLCLLNNESLNLLN